MSNRFAKNLGRSFSRLLVFVALGASVLIAAPQKPQITDISPSSGQIGSTVRINGSSFSATPSLNRILFTAAGGGSVTAPVISASSNSLTVTVPSGAISGKVWVQSNFKSNGVLFTVTTTTNQPPTVNAGPDLSGTMTSGLSLTGAASDDGIPSGALYVSWSQVSGPGTTTFAPVDSLGTTATFSAAGTYVLRLTATDGALTSTDDMTATIVSNGTPPVNQAPVVNAGSNQTVTLPAGTTVSGTATDDGLPNNSLSVAWSQVSGPGTAVFGTAGSLTSTVTFPTAGSYVLKLYASDSLLSNSSQMTVTVLSAPAANQKPTVNAGSNQSVTMPSGVMLSGTATDDGLPNGTLTVGWSKVSGPGTVSLGTPTALTSSATFSAAGSYVMRLTANDSQLSNTSDTTVTVSSAPATNQAPNVNAGSGQTVTLPSGVSLSGTATDDGLPNNTLTVAWSKVSGPGTVTFSAPSAVTGSATFSAAGTYVLRLTGNDSALSSTSDVTMNVLSAPSGSVSSQGTTPGGVNVMSTFQAISVRAAFSGDDNSNNSAVVQYRKAGTTAWMPAYAPLIDRRASLGGATNPYVNQARVSIVGLTASTQYEVQVLWSDSDGVAAQPGIATISTLSYTPPTGGSTITVTNDSSLASALNSVSPGQTIHLNPGTYSPFSITRSGTPSAWITIEGDAAGGTTIGGSGVSQNVRIAASYVIVQRLKLSDSDWHGIYLETVNHVFVQDNTVQNAGAKCATDLSGHYGDGGITISNASDNIYILRNNVNSTSLNGCTATPIWDSPGAGIQWYNINTLIVQGNTVTGGFRDAITADNSQIVGENIDIVGNTLSGYKDDGTESKGTNINVRMWSNKILVDNGDTCFAGNTNTTTNVYGPLYIFRNSCRVTTSNPSGTTVYKLGGAPTFLFHNSVDASTAGTRWDGFVGVTNNVVAYNNALKTGGSAIDYGATGSVFDYNLHLITSGSSFAYLWNSTSYDTLATFKSGTGQEIHGKQMEPKFLDTNLSIDSTSPAFDSGMILPNFNDLNSAWPYSGAAPDIGVCEYWPK